MTARRLPAQPTLVIETDPPGSGNFQGQYISQDGRYVYIPEGLKVYDDRATKTFIREDTIIYRLTVANGYWDQMRLEAENGSSIHLTSMGVLNGGTVLVTWNDKAGNALVEMPFQPARTIHKQETRRIGSNLVGNLQISLSPTETRCAVRRIQDTTETYTRRSTDEVRANIDHVFGKPVVVPRRDDRVVQGFGLVGYQLFICTGLTPHPQQIEEWDFITGALVAIHDAAQFGPLPTDNPAFTWVEFEGLQGNKVTTKVGSGTRRRVRTWLHGL